MRILSWLLAFGLTAATSRVVTFDNGPLGQTPPEWTVAMTNHGQAPQWEILKDMSAATQPYVFAQVSADPARDRPGARPLSPGDLQRRHLPRWRCQRAPQTGLRARGAGRRTRLAVPRRKQLLSGARQRPPKERPGVQSGERPPRAHHGSCPPRDPQQRLEHP